MSKYTNIIIGFVFLCGGCAVNPAYNQTPLYKDISGQDRQGDGSLAMSEAYCRNMVNSYSPEYQPPGGYYSTPSGQALATGVNRIRQAASGPSYDDCMISQGWQLVGYE